ncbi:DUF4279 domain-containing protein [Rhizobacter sp. Root1221]|uniref:DUF4279 domain-containing protein n=1 Tax=Rhizobacter sp. Root1221 TaxID=1736433 RepID=UPI0009E935F4
MSCLETFATLRIFSDTVSPEDVARTLGIEPTCAYPRDPQSKYKQRRAAHYWSWCSERYVQSQDGLAHVRHLTSLLGGKLEQLDQLRSAGCAVDICCYWVSSGQGGPLLDLQTLRDLADLKLEIHWDIYFADEAEYAEDRRASSAGSDA